MSTIILKKNEVRDTMQNNNDAVHGFRLHEVLEDLLQTRMQRRKKKARTREILIAATARELDRVGYEQLTIDGIVNTAGIVRATFYGHFRNRVEAVATVIRKYYALVRLKRPRGRGNLPIREAIHNSNQYYLNLALQNPRLLEARNVLSLEDPALGRMMLRINDNWARKFIRNLSRHGLIEPGGADFDTYKLKAIAMIKMSNGLLREVILRQVHASSEFQYPSDLVVQVMDEIWIRTFLLDSESISSHAARRTQHRKWHSVRDRNINPV
jgi:AcrR family transcriptional regulator